MSNPIGIGTLSAVQFGGGGRGEFNEGVITPVAVVASTGLAITLASRPPLGATVIAIAASLACAQVAIKHPRGRAVWIALAVWAGGMAANTLLLQLRATNGTWVDRLPEVALGLCALSATVAGWIGARPFLADPQTRPHVLIAFPSAAVGLLGILVSDAHYTVGGSSLVRTVGLAMIVLSFPVVAVYVGHLARLLSRRGRFAEVTLAFGVVGHAIAHGTSLALQRNEGIWLAIVLSGGAMLVAARLPSARDVGTRVGSTGPELHVRLWPAVLAGAMTVLAWSWVRSSTAGIDRFTLAVLLLGALTTAAFAGRELRGPRKPLVVPFGPKDRAIHGVPGQLMSGRVRLVGRPVHRVGDGTIVGIEAEPSWSGDVSLPLSLTEAAQAAGLCSWLQNVTLTSAQAHLPAVLLNLSGDDPFLSVPFDPSYEDPLSIAGDLDGLLLRTSTVATSLVPWQDRGAMVQAEPSSNGHELVVDVVGVQPGEPVPPIAMGLVRGPSAFAVHRVSPGAMFVINESLPPTNLSAILSPADATDPGSVGPWRRRESAQVDGNGNSATERVTDR